jgi:hypothetical protein
MRVFQIGFNKCGTRSFAHWFERCGHRSVHWDRGRLASTMRSNREEGLPLLRGYEDYVLYSDMENIHDVRGLTYAYEWFGDLHRQYPDGKFLMNIRPMEKWIRSRLNHVTYLQDTMAALGVDERNALAAWEKHYREQTEKADAYFQAFPGRFLVFDIENEPVEKVCRFLEGLDLDPLLYEHVAPTARREKALSERGHG